MLVCHGKHLMLGKDAFSTCFPYVATVLAIRLVSPDIARSRRFYTDAGSEPSYVHEKPKVMRMHEDGKKVEGHELIYKTFGTTFC